MDTYKKCDTRNRLPSSRDKGPRSFKAADGIERTYSNRLTFAEDFMMEHSSTGLRFSAVGNKVRSRDATQQPPSTQHFGFPS